jgi:serine/threonine protein kinase
MSIAPGSRLAHYEIVSTIGSGGMGVVYRARDTRLGRDVAIKVMAPHVAADPDMRSRFESEARAVAALSHPGILSIYELGIAEGRPFAVMELLEGQNLRTRIAHGALPWREAAEIAGAVADALAVAHGKGIVHRDLKPENVFLTSDGTVKILDFGLAHQRTETTFDGDSPTIVQTAPGIVVGTFGYMSPEQVTGERVDERTDIFALGCVLYEMLTGRQMFSGSTPQEVVARVLHDSAPDLSTVDPLAPHGLGAIVRRALERDPAHRFDSAREMAAALRGLLTSTAHGAATPPRASRARGKSVAVLPFVNAAGPELDYLGDGIAESIINSLSQIDTLRVVPRGVAFRYKGLQADPATLGAALNARTILTGRIAQHGDMLSIQTELVDTRTESQLWGEQYRQPVGDVVTIQQEIAWHISEALRLRLTAAQKRKLASRPTVRPDAYQAYLRGRYHWNHWTPDGFRRALEEFQRAVDIDPLYALAYAGLGDTFAALAYYGTWIRSTASHARGPPRTGRCSSIPISPRRTSPWPSSSCSPSGTGRRPSASCKRPCRATPSCRSRTRSTRSSWRRVGAWRRRSRRRRPAATSIRCRSWPTWAWPGHGTSPATTSTPRATPSGHASSPRRRGSGQHHDHRVRVARPVRGGDPPHGRAARLGIPAGRPSAARGLAGGRP